MSALNVRGKSVELETPRPPLVADMGAGYFLWVEGGRGFVLSTANGEWRPLDSANGIGGTVLSPGHVAALVLEFGRPS